MARDGVATYSNITDGIIDNTTESGLDVIIQDFLNNPDNEYFDYPTYSGTDIPPITYSGTGVPPTASGVTLSGSMATEGYWEDTTWSGVWATTDWYEATTSGSTSFSGTEAEEPNETPAGWRRFFYKNAYLDAAAQQAKKVTYDNVTTVSGRSDMEGWENLLDDDPETGMTYTVTGTQYIQIERPVAKQTTAVRARMDNANGKAIFASSTNRIDWEYYAAAEGVHTVSGVDMTAYEAEGDALTNYIQLPMGNNIMGLPTGIETLWSRMYLTTTGIDYTTTVIDFDFSDTFTADDIVAGTLNTSLVQIGDSGGKMIISGSTIQIYDASDNLIVELGELS